MLNIITDWTQVCMSLRRLQYIAGVGWVCVYECMFVCVTIWHIQKTN